MKLICTRGIPASGKTTWTKEQNADFYITKDEIREELHSGVWSKGNEKEVIEFERKSVEHKMKNNFPLIIVDNTHLGISNPHVNYYKKLAEKYEYEFEVKDFYISREEAIKRDKAREKSVGVEVIDRMIRMSSNGGYPSYPTYRECIPNLPPAYIFDIDGTLAHMRDKRSPYDYTKVSGDELNKPLSELLLDLALTNDIIILSGREDSCRKETIKWLKDNGILYSKIYMRAAGDTRKDSIIKREIYETHIKEHYNINGVFDDRNQVVDMWRLELNLPCYQAWYGCF